MAAGARVTSIADLIEFRAKLTEFGVDASKALGSLDMELRRACEWLEEQGKFWSRELQRCQEKTAQAKNELVSRKYLQANAQSKGYSEQEIALRKARARQEEAEAKLANCRRWSKILPPEILECEGPARQLSGMVESELRHGIALLDQKIVALEAYVQLTSAVSPVPADELPRKLDQPASATEAVESGS